MNSAQLKKNQKFFINVNCLRSTGTTFVEINSENMENLGRTFKANELLFNNYSKQATLSGVLFQDNLSYESKLVISTNKLNQLLSILQFNNPDQDVNALLVTDEFPNDEVYYSMNLSALSGKLTMDFLFEDQQYKLIRA